MPQGRNIVKLCKTISCDMAGKDMLKLLLKELGISFNETTKDNRISLNIQAVSGSATADLQ
jgi:[NiFe] hydrogenase diaphorase moiety large subunit